MIDLSCLNQPGPAAKDLLLSDGLPATMAYVAVIAVLLAVPVSVWVRRVYRRRVVRLMRFQQVVPAPKAWWERNRRLLDSPPATPAAESGAGLKAVAAVRQRRIDRATQVALLVLALGVAALARGAGWGGMLGTGIGTVLLALGPFLANMRPALSRHALWIGLACGAIGAVLMERVDPGDDTTADVATGVVICGAAYAAMLHRTLRKNVIPLSLLGAVTLLLLIIPAGLAQKYGGGCFPASSGNSPAAGLIFMTLGGVCVWLGLRSLGLFARLEDRGWIDELSMIPLFAVATACAIMFAAEHSYAAFLLLPATVGAYGIALGKHERTGGRRLLVLRVFATKPKLHSLLDTVQTQWRYVGPVFEIGGPDLAAMNVTSYEFMMFLSGRLHEIFLPEAASPHQLQARLRMGAGRDGRYAVNQVFCFDSAWRKTVQQLMEISDAIVLDVRGLTAEREGTAYEIGLLAQSGLLASTVAAGDATTDWAHVDRLIAAAGQDSSRLQRHMVTSAKHADALFDRLLAVAATAE